MGAEVDPASGIPKSEIEKPSTVEKYNRLNEQKARSDQLVESLNSEQGQMVLNEIKECLLARVNKLIDDDPECRVLKRLLVGMGIKISLGEKAIDNLMKLVMRKQTQ